MRLFLTALVGFLVILIFILLVLLQTVTGMAEDVVMNQWSRMAEAADASLRSLPSATTPDDLDARFTSLRTTYGFAAVELRGRAGSIVSGIVPGAKDGVAMRRATQFGTTTYWFDASELHGIRRAVRLSAVICIVATTCGMILLLLYLPKILRPIEEMMDHARELDDREVGGDEANYLIQTFKSSIARLREQEAELKQLHEAEKTRADELQLVTATLTRSLTSGFISLDPEGHVVDMNAAARTILGLPETLEIRRQPIESMLGASPFTEALVAAFRARQTLSRQEVSLSVAGVDVQVGLATVPLFAADQHFLGMLALFTDLTPIRELEARVYELQTLADLGEVASGIAHEFRNSLSTILGYLKLARRADTPSDRIERVAKAEAEASLLASAVERLLSFARPMQLVTEPVDLLALSREVVARVEDNAAENIKFVVQGAPAEIDGDRTLLSRAIENVVRNAADSIAQKQSSGAVSVSVDDKPCPTIRIADDGVGVDPAHAARLFLPFQSDKPNGFGLGLSIARKIILLHGGTIRLQGEPGIGAAVTIDFPAIGSVIP